MNFNFNNVESNDDIYDDFSDINDEIYDIPDIEDFDDSKKKGMVIFKSYCLPDNNKTKKSNLNLNEIANCQ